MDDNAWFTIHRPDPAVALPIIIHVPHASRFVPMHCHGDFVLTEAELREVIEALVDHDTDRLALPLVALGAHVLVNNVCRVVMDPERYAADADEIAAVWGMGPIYVHAHDGRRLRRRNWGPDDRAERMDEFYHPYHRAMRDLVVELRERFDAPVHIIDLHSFPQAPLPYETDAVSRPWYCLGYDEVHAPRNWLAWWAGRAAGVPGLIDHNRPFAGSFVPGDLPPHVTDTRSLMVEVNRTLVPVGGPDHPLLAHVHDFLRFACEDVRAAIVEGSRR